MFKGEEESKNHMLLHYLNVSVIVCIILYILGLKINLEKSELFPIGRIDNVELLAANLGCKVGSLPTTYLGLPLGAHYNSSVVWDGVEEHFRKRFSMWKKQNISKGGRVTLINSTLTSLLLYLMSILHLPKKVKLKLEQIQRCI